MRGGKPSQFLSHILALSLARSPHPTRADCPSNVTALTLPICEFALGLAWITNQKSLDLLGGPLGISGGMMTEFGAVGGDPVSIKILDTVLKGADQRLQSWAYWSFKSFHDITTSGPPDAEGMFNSDGSLQHAKVLALVRPYAPSISGTPVSMTFDPATRIFDFSWDAAAGPTEIVLHDYIYPDRGYTVSITPANAAIWAPVSPGGPAVCNATIVVKRSSAYGTGDGGAGLDSAGTTRVRIRVTPATARKGREEDHGEIPF